MQNVYIWGNGNIASNFLSKAKLQPNIQITTCVVSHKTEACSYFHSLPIIEPNQIKNEDFDYLIVASSYTDEILSSLICNTIIQDKQKIIILHETPGSKALGFNALSLGKIISNLYDFMYDIFNLRTISIWRNGSDFNRNDVLWKSNNGIVDGKDYIRINTFDLVANQINQENIVGSVAELGVFRGDFAKYINMKFPNRPLYLFDTFSGFDEREVLNDVQAGNINSDFAENFTATSVEMVLSKMVTPNSCIIRKGLFPNSLIQDDYKQKFAFVSIDVDFENSIYEGLKFFYPRLSEGGFIFLHDYNHLFLHGVKKGVEKYEKKYGKIIKIPISDEAGSIIITK